MHYKIKIILLTLCLNISWSCLPDLVIEESKGIASVDLINDVHVYSNTSINIDSSKIYNLDGKYYFGNFYYPTLDSIYILDTFNKRMVNIDNEKNSKIIPLDYSNVEESSIVLVDDEYIYIKGSTIAFTENIETTNIVVTSPLNNPETTYEETTEITSVSEIYTNYNKVDTISLIKLSKKGEFIFEVKNIAINDDSSHILKVIPSINSGFAIFKNSNNEDALNIYNSNGEFNKSIILSELESIDIKNRSYKEIIDISYIESKKVFMILVMSVENGIHNENIIYTIDESTSKIEELHRFKRDNIMIPMGITGLGIVVSSGVENGQHFIIKENAFMPELNVREGIELNNTLRDFKIFNNGIYAFKLTNDTLIFYEF